MRTSIFLVALLFSAPLRAETLYSQFGGMEVLTRIADRTIDLAKADPRIQRHWKFVKLSRVKEKLALQFCELTEGPCKYDGDPMKPLHKAMKLTTADFNALVEALQQAMREEKVPFAVQNKLIAILAPMHKDIVTVR